MGGRKMLAWIIENIGTILICVILFVIVAAVIRKMVHDKKAGKSTCGCSCGHCAMNGTCHSKK